RGREPVCSARALRPLDEACDAERSAARHRQRPRIDEAEHALACEYETRTPEPSQVKNRRDHKRQPEGRATMPPLMIRSDTRPNPAARIMPANACGRGKRRIDSTR